MSVSFCTCRASELFFSAASPITACFSFSVACSALLRSSFSFIRSFSRARSASWMSRSLSVAARASLGSASADVAQVVAAFPKAPKGKTERLGLLRADAAAGSSEG